MECENDKMNNPEMLVVTRLVEEDQVKANEGFKMDSDGIPCRQSIIRCVINAGWQFIRLQRQPACLKIHRCERVVWTSL